MISASGIQGKAKSSVVSFLKSWIKATDLLFVILIPLILYNYRFIDNFKVGMYLQAFLLLVLSSIFLWINKDLDTTSGIKVIKSIIIILFASLAGYFFLIKMVKLDSALIGWVLSLNVWFLLTPLIQISFVAFSLIPQSNFKSWDYVPDRLMPDFDLIDMSMVRIVQFKIKKHPSDKKFTIIRAKGVPGMRFEDFFHIWLTEYNDQSGKQPVIVYDKNKNTFMWQFRKATFWGPADYIDPDATMAENRIKENQIIIASRLRKEFNLEISHTDNEETGAAWQD